MGLGKLVLFAGVASGAFVIACSGPPPPLQADIQTVIQGGPQAPAATCNRAGDFIDVPLTSPNPTDPNAVMVPTGSQGILLTCQVLPQTDPNSFQVTVTAQVTLGSAPGTVTFTGIFTKRKSPTDTSQIPNIRGIFQDSTGLNLVQKDCYAQYTSADPATLTGTPLPPAADVYADNNGGRIWVSVFCPDAVNQNTSNQITKACQGTATFRFENCASH